VRFYKIQVFYSFLLILAFLSNPSFVSQARILEDVKFQGVLKSEPAGSTPTFSIQISVVLMGNLSSGMTVSVTWSAPAAFCDTGGAPMDPLHSGDSTEVYGVWFGDHVEVVCQPYYIRKIPPPDQCIQPPIVDFTFDPYYPKVGYTIQFTDLSQACKGNSLVSWSWNFGDGGTSTQQHPTHSYSTKGDKLVCLNVKDSNNQYNSGCRTVKVKNEFPIARFFANPTSGNAPLTVSFDASSSSDSDGTIVSYQWNFGDGSTGSNVRTSHTYSSKGTYTANLTIQDNDGASSTANATITVNDNKPPVARINANPTSGKAPLTVTFDASGSYDPDGNITSYSWDFGDGSQGSGTQISHTYSAARTYAVTLTVRDNQGAHGDTTATIDVTEKKETDKEYLMAALSARIMAGYLRALKKVYQSYYEDKDKIILAVTAELSNTQETKTDKYRISGKDSFIGLLREVKRWVEAWAEAKSQTPGVATWQRLLPFWVNLLGAPLDFIVLKNSVSAALSESAGIIANILAGDIACNVGESRAVNEGITDLADKLEYEADLWERGEIDLALRVLKDQYRLVTEIGYFDDNAADQLKVLLGGSDTLAKMIGQEKIDYLVRGYSLSSVIQPVIKRWITIIESVAHKKSEDFQDGGRPNKIFEATQFRWCGLKFKKFKLPEGVIWEQYRAEICVENPSTAFNRCDDSYPIIIQKGENFGRFWISPVAGLPPGVRIDNFELSGTPEQAGTYCFDMVVGLTIESQQLVHAPALENSCLKVRRKDRDTNTITLNYGWNLIYIGTEENLQFSALERQCGKVYVFTISQGTLIAVNDTLFSDQSYLARLDGNTECKIKLVGKVLPNKSKLILSSGWNIVGMPYDVSSDSIYDSACVHPFVFAIRNGKMENIGRNRILRAFEGYYIRVDQFCEVFYSLKNNGISNTILDNDSRMKIMISVHGITFNVNHQGIDSFEVEIYTLGGKNIFKSNRVNGRSMHWNGTSNNGALLSNGVILTIITTYSSDGTAIQRLVKRLVIMR
jgi:PKD repeat protein